MLPWCSKYASEAASKNLALPENYAALLVAQMLAAFCAQTEQKVALHGPLLAYACTLRVLPAAWNCDGLPFLTLPLVPGLHHGLQAH